MFGSFRKTFLSSISKCGHLQNKKVPKSKIGIRNFFNNLVRLTVKQKLYCALIRNTHLPQKIQIAPYWCPLFLISSFSSKYSIN